MDSKQVERRPRRRLRIWFGVLLVLAFFGIVGFILFSWPLPLTLAVVLIVLAGTSAAVFATYFLPKQLSERVKRAFAIGVGAITLITTLVAVPALQNATAPVAPTSLPGAPTPEGDPLTAILDLTSYSQCEIYVIPAALIKSLPARDALTAKWVYENGGASLTEAGTATLTIQGKSEDAVLIKGLRVVDFESFPPTTKQVILSPCGPPQFATGGDFTVRYLDVTMNDPPKVRIRAAEGPAEFGAPAAKFPFKTSNSDPEVFDLYLHGRPGLHTWRLALDWTSGGRSGTTILDHGFGKIKSLFTGEQDDEESLRNKKTFIYYEWNKGTWRPYELETEP